MFPIQIKPDEAVRELVEFNQKVIKGIDSIADMREIDVAHTPKEVVYQEDNCVLYHYEPKVDTPCAVPIVIVYALVNRPYIVDLQQDRSIVQNLLNLGMDIYLIDWGYTDRGDMFLTMDDYINGYVDNCVNAVRERHGLDAVNVLGICQGGTFSLCYASMHPKKVKNLITMVTPVDFSARDSLLNVWVQGLDVDVMVDTLGNVPGDFMNGGFLMLKPFQLMAQKYVGIVSILDQQQSMRSFLRMEVDLRQPRPGRGDVPSVHQGLVPGQQADQGRARDRRRAHRSGARHHADPQHLRHGGPPRRARVVHGPRALRGFEGRHDPALPGRAHRHLRKQPLPDGARSGACELGEGALLGRERPPHRRSSPATGHEAGRPLEHRDHDRLAAMPSRTAASCSTAKSRSAISCSADTCTRMRASPLGTTG